MPTRFTNHIGPLSLNSGHRAELSFDFTQNWQPVALDALGAIDVARQRVRDTITVLQHDMLAQRIAFGITNFFRLPPILHGIARPRILASLEQVANGLNADLKLKIGTQTKDGQAVAGMVTFTNRPSTKWYHRDVFVQGENEEMRAGAIHLSTAAAGSALTLIHEATHKFTGARDYFYLGAPDTSGNYTIASTTTLYDASDNSQGLYNADSFAYFCTYLARLYGQLS